MCLDKKNQCKRTYDEYQLWQARRLLKLMTPEDRLRLAETIQARQLFGGEQVQNQAVLNLVREVNEK